MGDVLGRPPQQIPDQVPSRRCPCSVRFCTEIPPENAMRPAARRDGNMMGNACISSLVKIWEIGRGRGTHPGLRSPPTYVPVLTRISGAVVLVVVVVIIIAVPVRMAVPTVGSAPRPQASATARRRCCCCCSPDHRVSRPASRRMRSFPRYRPHNHNRQQHTAHTR